MKSERNAFAAREPRDLTPVVAGGPDAALAKDLVSLFRRASSTRVFNTLSGVVPATVFFLILVAQSHKLWLLFNQPDPVGSDAQFYASVISSISNMVFLSLIVTLLLVRKQPVSKAPGIMPRLTAIVGTFLIVVLLLFPAPEPSLVQSVIGLVLVSVGSVLSAIAISFLGGSFSIMAEARELVTRGVYSIIRHPLYVAEEIAMLGVIVQLFSLPAGLLLIAHIAIQIQRMKNEEAVLKKAFPEYETYMACTRRVVPGVY